TKWGAHPIVVLTEYSLIKKAFQHPSFQGRPDFFSYRIVQRHRKRGVALSDGLVWSENRHFLLTQLRNLGMGKTFLGDAIADEASLLMDHLEKACLDRPVVIDSALNTAVINVLWMMFTSKRYDVGDLEIVQYVQVLEKILYVSRKKIFLLDIIPVLPKILPMFILNAFFDFNVGENYFQELTKMSENKIREHLTSLDPDNPRDIIDYYLLEKTERDSNGFLTHFDAQQLCGMMNDTFLAGLDTTASTLRWMMLYLTIYPDVQAKAHQCLDEAVPRTRLPCLADKPRLAYVEALVLDVLRLSSLAPLLMFHRATDDVVFEGYTIPQDTLLMACSEICHKNKSFWQKPDQLYPEHFLDENGKLDSDKENFIPFSVGRRQCVGESLARMQLFLFTAAILHRFKLEAATTTSLKSESDPATTIFNRPDRFELVLRKRN
ncbi:Cytochrome P450 CYP3213B1, partial [Hyalella azteca]